MDKKKLDFSVDELIDEVKNKSDNDEDPYYEEPLQDRKKPVKKKKWSLFSKKDEPDFDENEEMYYGIQVKPLNELRKGFDATGEIKLEDETFAKLFDNTQLDDEVEKNFQRISRERRRRVAEAVETAGVDMEQMEDELGIVAPMPVTSFAADPYTKKAGIAAEIGTEDEFQKAMMHTAESQTMEIKLNVLNDTVEIQKNLNLPAVDDDTISKILEDAENDAEVEDISSNWEMPNTGKSVEISEDESFQRNEDHKEKAFDLDLPQIDSEAPSDELRDEDIPEGDNIYDFVSRQVMNQIAKDPAADEKPSYEPKEKIVTSGRQPRTSSDEEVGAKAKMPNISELKKPAKESFPVSQNTSVMLEIPKEESDEFPKVESKEKYRSKTVPIHIVNIDVLQSAILAESSQLDGETGKTSPMRRFASKLKQAEEEQEDEIESIDDYTDPSDARAIANELTGNMRQLSLRLLVTGLSAVVLFITTLVCESGFTAQNTDGSPVAYLIMTIVLVCAAAGFCYKSLIGGLKSLMRFTPTGDSATAVAVVAVLIQSVLGFVFQFPVATGMSHLYGVVVVFALFLNTLGKLTMLRRIHSNFRFVTGREQKYAVKTYGDYNTSLRLAKDCVAEAPVIVYQKKTEFLRRFLQLSYEADPAEASSQNLAPIGLVASLVLCLVTLIITQNIFTAVTAFTASSCVLVAFAGMLAVNLPISKLCKRARRAGAMIVGYQGVSEMSKANAVMVDAADLFPSGTVVLEGVKTFGSGKTEEAILAATSLIKEIGGTLADVFSQVINESEDDLPRVTNLSLEDEHGVSGSVAGQKVLVGNRTLMMNHHIQLPEKDEVTKYTVGGQKVLFLAVDGVLEAMLVLTYRADRRRRSELQRMEDNGISLIVRSVDANITKNMIGKLFGISPSSVNVTTGELANVYEELVKDESKREDALVATKGRVESMTNIVAACVKERKTVSLVVAMQNIGVILGFIMVTLVACFSAMAQLSAVTVLMYEIFWLLLLVLLPKLKKQ